MKSLGCLLLALVLNGCCFDDQCPYRPTEQPRAQIACAASDDPYNCIRINCATAKGANFNEFEKRCECPSGSILSTVNAYTCMTPTVAANDPSATGLSAVDPHRQYEYAIQASNSELLQRLLKDHSNAIPFLPHWNFLQKAFRVFASSSEMAAELKLDEKSSRDPLSVVLNLLFQPQLDLNSDANAGVKGKILGNSFWQVAVMPTGQNPRTGSDALDVRVFQALGQIAAGVGEERVTSLSDDACNGQCTATRTLFDDSEFQARRIRYYFRGGVVQDQISIFDKQRHQTAITLYLMDGKVANYILQESDGLYLHGSEKNVNDSRIAKFQENLASGAIAPYRLQDKSETPVLIFEATKNEKIDSVIPRGPWTVSHIFGWFKPEDQLPFFKNEQDHISLPGEEEIESGVVATHGLLVARIASGEYEHPLIPLSATDLTEGFAQKLIRNYREAKPGQNLVANISELFSMSASACKNNSIGQAIQSSSNVLWIVSAGNSGHELAPDSMDCPQSLDFANVIRVAATAGDEVLSQVSTYGDGTVDIAEVGCGPGLEVCDPADVGTSFAAPRVARKAADLATKYSHATPKQIRFAILITARVPFQRLPVRSGGLIDAEAADRLLAKLSEWPRGIDLLAEDWQKLLVEVKATQFSNLPEYRIRKSVQNQTRLLIKNTKDLL